MKKELSTINRITWLSIAVAAVLLVYMLPLPAPLHKAGDTIELTAQAKACIAILVFAIILWVTEAVPFPVTSLMIFLLLPAFGITGMKEAVEIGFGNPILMFLIGVLLLSCAFTHSGLGTRLSYMMISKVGVKANRVILGFLMTGTLLSMWLSDMAVAAMLVPVALGILKSIDSRPMESNFGKCLMISCCWGPAFGGIATPAGAAPNPMIIGLLRNLAGIELSFVKWMLFGVPAAIFLVPVGWILLLKMFPLEMKELPLSVETIKAKQNALGPISSRERNALIIFLLTVVLWISSPLIKTLTDGKLDFSISGVALFSGILMFLPGIGVLSWKEAQADMDWGGIILIMGGMAIGMMLFKTGAARWISLILMGNVAGMPPFWRIFAVALLVLLIKVIFTSNTITGVIMVSLLIGLSKDFNLDPWLLVAPAALATSLSIILVTSTPTNVIPYTAGYFSISDMAKSGIIMSFFAAIAITLSIVVIGALTGYYKL